MEAVIYDFFRGWVDERGEKIAQTLSPERPTDELRAIWESCDAADVKAVVKRSMLSNGLGGKRNHLDKQFEGWIDIYAVYWKSVGELVAVLDQSAADRKVCLLCYSTAALVCLLCFLVLGFFLDKGVRVLEGVALQSDPRLQYL